MPNSPQLPLDQTVPPSFPSPSGRGQGEGPSASCLESFTRYLAQERRISGLSITAYRYCIRTYLAHLRGIGIEPGQATRETVLVYLDGRRQNGLSSSSLFQATIALRHFYRFLLREDPTVPNPTQGIGLPKLVNKLPQPLTLQEMEKLLKAPRGTRFRNVRNRAILEVLYATGMRVSELTGLQIADLNLGEGYLRVMGKGSRERIVPFGSRAKEAMERYLAARAKKFPNVAEPLFLGISGNQLTRGGLWDQIKSCARRAGITHRVSPHILRHSFATHMLSGGADLRAIQEMLGHKRITTTEIYTHVEPEHLRRVWDRAHPRQ
ncbi:MAG: tyrosine recombinase XerD [Elusimicrobia bacterium]|nr:tyrosine recombinase XerD [Elusimicrobiota bacterium]